MGDVRTFLSLAGRAFEISRSRNKLSVDGHDVNQVVKEHGKIMLRELQEGTTPGSRVLMAVIDHLNKTGSKRNYFVINTKFAQSSNALLDKHWIHDRGTAAPHNRGG